MGYHLYPGRAFIMRILLRLCHRHAFPAEIHRFDFSAWSEKSLTSACHRPFPHSPRRTLDALAIAYTNEFSIKKRIYSFTDTSSPHNPFSFQTKIQLYDNTLRLHEVFVVYLIAIVLTGRDATSFHFSSKDTRTRHHKKWKIKNISSHAVLVELKF